MPKSAIETTQVDHVLPADEIGSRILELSNSEASTRMQVMPPKEESAMEATGSTYSCPECGGVLEEAQESNMLRFRCRVGHIYSPDSLMADQTVAVERALWAAIRSMEEQAEFSQRLANNSKKKKHIRLERRFREKAESNRENASVLRELLQRNADELLEMPEERTGSD